MAASEGFEPPYPDSESGGLPLTDPGRPTYCWISRRSTGSDVTPRRLSASVGEGCPSELGLLIPWETIYLSEKFAKFLAPLGLEYFEPVSSIEHPVCAINSELDRHIA